MENLFILVLGIAFMVLFVLVFRSPAPKIDRLIFFVLWLMVGALLGYVIAVKVFDYDPDPTRLAIARAITQEKIIDLTEIVPGLPADLDFIDRVDTDEEEELEEREWLVFYRYDEPAPLAEEKQEAEIDDWLQGGPFGAAIYDTDLCRPPAILSYELVPINYDYLAQDSISLDGSPETDDVVVENTIAHTEDFSNCFFPAEGPDRPELYIFGRTSNVRTDLNIFRKVGQDLNCVLRQQWREAYGETPMPCPLGYQNIGSFRGNYRVSRLGSTVFVYDRAPFERSQFVIKKTYVPDPATGSYLQPVAGSPEDFVLRPPVEVSIEFGPGQPEDTQEVYYPEKTVLAFFTQLGDDTDAAMENVCSGKGSGDNYDPANFGLLESAAALDNVVVCEISYDPDIAGERNHEPQTVQVRVVEVTDGSPVNCTSSRHLSCTVIADTSDPTALPYGCQWCLSACVYMGP